MKITKIIERDMWHRVPNHSSKCRNLHWHRYKAYITLSWDVIWEKGISDEWMVIDFSHIKQISQNFIDTELDHWYMFQVWDPIWEKVKELDMKYMEVEFVPTAENIAKFLFDKLEWKFDDIYWTNLKLDSIKLYETPTSYVIYNK